MIHLLFHVLLLVFRESIEGSRPRRVPDAILLARDPRGYLARRPFIIGATWDTQVRWFPCVFVPCLLVAGITLAWGTWLLHARNDNGPIHVLLMALGLVGSFVGFL